MLCNSKQESQHVSQLFLGCHTWGYVAGDVAANFPVSGFLWGFAAGGDRHWMVRPDEPSGAFWGKIHLFASFAHTHGHCHQKKPLGEKKKKNLHRCRKHLCVNFSSSPATSSPASAARVIPLAFPTPFPRDAKIREVGGSGEAPLGSQQPWKAALVVPGREAWSCLSELRPYILMAFWLDIQSTAESRKRKRLWHIYTVCWHWLLKKKIKKIPDYLRLVLEVWSPHVIEKPSGIHSWTSSPP